MPREKPIAQLVFDARLTATFGFQPCGDGFLGGRDVEPVEVIRVHQGAIAGVCRLRNIAARNDFDDRQAELAGELPVALVVAGHGHDRSGAVSGQHVVGNEDRHLRAVGRVGRINAQEHAGLGLVLLTFQIGLRGDVLPVGGDGLCGIVCAVGPARIHTRRPLRRHQTVDQLMLGSQHQIRCAEKGVRPGGEHL